MTVLINDQHSAYDLKASCLFNHYVLKYSISRYYSSRLRAVSLLLENPRGKVAEHESRASGEAASSARGGRRAKRETAMVSYNDCEAL